MANDEYLDHPLSDYRWVIRHQPGIDQAIIDWYVSTHAGGIPEIAAASIQHINWRAGPEFSRWERTYGAPLTLRKLLDGQWPHTTSLIPITLGNWHGNFMYDWVPGARWYFAPSLLAWSEEMRQEYYRWSIGQGLTHLWVNAQQADWDPRYTHGGFDAHAQWEDTVHLITVLEEIRAAQLIPCVGIHDQPQAASLPWIQLLAQTQDLINATHNHVALYMVMGWELNENRRWGTGDVRNPAIIELFQRIDNRGRDLGIHYAPPALGNTDDHGKEDLAHGGFQLYRKLPPHAVRLQQIPKAADDEQLRERTYAAMIVNRDTGTGICAFEHTRKSVPGREVTPSRSLAEATRRAGICMEVLREMPKNRRGGFND